jgi:SAM-dependent methyltransferase
MLKKIQPHTEFGNQKYRNYIQPANQDVFEIFNNRLSTIDPEWFTKEILDFGCNVGHLLGTSNGKISPIKYTGVDVHKKSLEIAKELYPDASWVHYNGYNSTFNPDGNIEEFFTVNKKPEIIIAYGVFTHCDFKEINRLITNLKNILADNGIILFSVWEDVHVNGYLTFLKNCFDLNLFANAQLANAKFHNSMYLINRETAILDKEETGHTDLNWLESFYNKEYILNSIPNTQFLNGTYSHHSIFLTKK